MFSLLWPDTNLNFSVLFILLSTDAVSLDKSKILLLHKNSALFCWDRPHIEGEIKKRSQRIKIKPEAIIANAVG